MTFYTQDYTVPARGESLLRRFFTKMGKAIEARSAAMSRRDQIDALDAKSDAELAEMGLSREHIVHYVFRDTYYI